MGMDRATSMCDSSAFDVISLPFAPEPFLMKRNRRMTCIFALAMVALSAASASADLTVTVTPDSTTGQTLWTFSGTSTYAETAPGGKFAAGDVLNIEEWKGGAGSDYVVTGSYNNYTTGLISGGITLTVTTGGTPSSGSITSMHIDHDTTGDDFGVGLLGTTDIPLTNGDLISWSGSGVFAVDLSGLNLGTFAFSSYGGSQAVSGLYGTLPLTLNVVPEPATCIMALAGLACGGYTMFRRRKRA
jgi:hypothetical protein